MPAKHRHAPPLPARFLDVLAALPAVAWVEDAGGNILARNFDPASDDHPAAISDAAPLATAIYPLPSVDGSPLRLRLVACISDADENDCHTRVIAALLSLLLGAARLDGLRFTPQQRDIHAELLRGSSYKEAAYNLGISHNALLVQITRMRSRLGDGIIPRLRRQCARQKTVNGNKRDC